MLLLNTYICNMTNVHVQIHVYAYGFGQHHVIRLTVHIHVWLRYSDVIHSVHKQKISQYFSYYNKSYHNSECFIRVYQTIHTILYMYVHT